MSTNAGEAAKKGEIKKKVGNHDKRLLFLNKTRGTDSRDGQSYILDLEFRWEMGRQNMVEGNKWAIRVSIEQNG